MVTTTTTTAATYNKSLAGIWQIEAPLKREKLGMY